MKSSITRLITVFLFLGTFAHAQDVIVLISGQIREGEVVEVKDGNVRIKSGPATGSMPLAQIKSVTMAAPAEFAEVLELSKDGDADKTYEKLSALVNKFRGLPSAWVERATVMLAEVLLDKGDIAGAEKAIEEFTKTYPEATKLADIGLARLALAKGDTAAAKEKVTTAIEEARKILAPKSGESASYAQALFVMGAILEKEGDAAAALENYMLIATVFHEDPSLVAKAKAAAEKLTKEKNAVAP